MSSVEPIRLYDATRDTEDCIYIFNATISPNLDFPAARSIGENLWCFPYLALSPTTCFVLDPAAIFCPSDLDPQSNPLNAVGYIIGTPDTAAFAAQLRSTYIPIILSQGPETYPWLFEENSSNPDPDSKTSTEAAVAQKSKETRLDEDYTAEQANIVADLRSTFLNAECSPFLQHPGLLARYPAHLHIDILPGYQGRGFGSELMIHFLQTLKHQDVPGVHLGMVASNTGARRFYERWGFLVCPEVLDGGASGETGREGDAVFLVKDLRMDED